MYGTQWESYMGINNLVKVVESEQVMSFEPIKSTCNNIVTSSSNLETPYEGFGAVTVAKIKVLLVFKVENIMMRIRLKFLIGVLISFQR
jgi:hypothetical protein